MSTASSLNASSDLPNVICKKICRKKVKRVMKYFLLALIPYISSYALADDSYFCLSDGQKSILLVPKDYPNTSEVKYYPYLKPIKISKVVRTEYGDQSGVKPEIFYTMNEIINRKITGQYTFNVQGYLVNYVDYLNLKTKKRTTFFVKYGDDLNLKGVNCL